jgi:tripartite-type tricarboxylate transporter receptor subunit TctC
VSLVSLRLLVSAAAAAALVCGGSALAQSFPSHTITLIAPFPAGGPSDAIGRVLQDPLRASLGQTVLIENAVGAGGNIGMGRLARAAPDGHTVGIGQWSTHVVNAITYKLPYDVMTDFEPIALLANAPQVLIARKTFPATDLKSLIAWLKANPGKANAATVGAAGGAKIAGLYFQQATGTTFPFVSYRGGAPAMQDLVGGQVDLMFDQGPNALGQLRNGTIKAYATMAKSRWFAAPDIPTIDEAGAPGLHIAYWHALWAPKGTPKDAVAKLNDAVRKALADPGVKKRLADLGQEIWPSEMQSPEALRTFHKSETEKWWPIVRATAVKAQ